MNQPATHARLSARRSGTFAVIALLLTLSMLQACSTEQEGEPRLESVVLSAEKDGAAQSVFSPTTPAVFLRADLVAIPDGSIVKAAWIAEETEVAPPNFAIDSTELTAGPEARVANYSLSKPDAGWPVGRYRVELSIDGQSAEIVNFSIAE